MNKRGPIVVVDDDMDDLHVITQVFKELGYTNEVITCMNGVQALEYLTKGGVHPFIILSDINMPMLDGFGLRDQVQTIDEIRQKCIPFVIISTSAHDQMVLLAYEVSLQGYFVKPKSYQELRATLKTIVEYWQICYTPYMTEDSVTEKSSN
jgi:CheY-like chemotaxis protein